MPNEPTANAGAMCPNLWRAAVHMKKALENGVSRDELIEVITHLAFYNTLTKFCSATCGSAPAFHRATAA